MLRNENRLLNLWLSQPFSGQGRCCPEENTVLHYLLKCLQMPPNASKCLRKWSDLVKVENYNVRGTWVAPSVMRPTLDVSSDHDLPVCGIEPRVGLCADTAEPAWDSLSPPAPSQHALSLKINKLKK